MIVNIITDSGYRLLNIDTDSTKITESDFKTIFEESRSVLLTKAKDQNAAIVDLTEIAKFIGKDLPK